MKFDYDMGTGRNELIWKISHDEETDELISEIKNCQDVNYSDNEGYTYLHYAALEHKSKVIKALLEKGANPNCVGKCGNVPILHALGRINEKNGEILQMFLDYGLDLDMLHAGETIREVIFSFEDPEYNEIIEKYDNS